MIQIPINKEMAVKNSVTNILLLFCMLNLTACATSRDIQSTVTTRIDQAIVVREHIFPESTIMEWAVGNDIVITIDSLHSHVRISDHFSHVEHYPQRCQNTCKVGGDNRLKVYSSSSTEVPISHEIAKPWAEIYRVDSRHEVTFNPASLKRHGEKSDDGIFIGVGPNGEEIRILDDDTVELKYPDGTIVRMKPDGTVRIESPNGAFLFFNKDGSISFIPGDDTEGPLTDTTFYPDGSVSVFDGDTADTTTTFPDGRKEILHPDGTITFVSKTGVEEHIDADDVKTTTYPDGTIVIEDPAISYIRTIYPFNILREEFRDGFTATTIFNQATVETDVSGNITITIGAGPPINNPTENITILGDDGYSAVVEVGGYIKVNAPDGTEQFIDP